MSYSRPASDAVDFSWEGESAYTRPASNAVDFSFVEGNLVSGFAPIAFGSPTMLPQIAGFLAITFGTPNSPNLQTPDVSGFAVTAFGLPHDVQVTSFAPVAFGTLRLLPHVVGFKPLTFGSINLLPHTVGIKATTFGTITLRNVHRARAGFRPCHFGTPTVPTARGFGTRGFLHARMGHPVAIKYLPE